MNKTLSVYLLAGLFFSGLSAFSQIKTTFPLNPDVRHGVLENGMNYYILHNEEPKDRASFYFVQNVGAILEEDDQNGLAHFLEHMAFNGTEHFEGKGIIDFLENHGVRFGYEINAGTSLDQTIYNLSNIPVNSSEGLLDSCLLVLHDWSGYLLLEDDEIEAERGVIHEEWRTRRNSQFRINSQTRKVLFKGSKYADRDVIGDLDVIDNFKHEALRSYYKTWYRPDLQAVVVVGDIDVDNVEEKVIDLFSTIPLRENLPVREYFEVPDNEDLLFCKATDPEAQFMAIVMIYKHDAPLVIDDNTYRRDMVRSLYTSMINNRFRELTQDPESSSLMAMTSYMPLTRMMSGFALQVVPKEGQALEAYEELMTGVERVKRDGFEQGELERVKMQMKSQYENFYQNRDEISNENWAYQLANHFLQAEPVFDPKTEFDMATSTLESIGIDEVNDIAQSLQTENNQVLLLTGPEKEGMVYPEREELQEVIEKVKSAEIEKYEDNVGDQPLVSADLPGSEVTSEFTISGIDAKGFVLGNGAKIVMMSTDFSEDEILFSAFSYGGSSLLPQDDLYTAQISANVASQSGLGDFDLIQLQKKLSGKIARINPQLSEFLEGFSGSSNIRDFETLLQLCYLQFESPRFDEKAYKVFVNQMETILSNLKADPNQAFQDSVSMLSSNYNPRTILFNDEFLNRLDFKKSEDIYRSRFSNASDFTFIIVGNVDIERDLPLVRKYIGSIKGDGSTEKFKDHDIGPAEGKSTVHFDRDMSVPKTTIYMSLSGDMEYSRKNQLCVTAVGDLLDKRYLETIREEEGGSYGVSVSASLGRLPKPEYQLVIQFDTDPEKKEKLLGIVNEEIEKLKVNGPDPQDLEEIKRSMIKVRNEQLDKNGFWLGAIRTTMLFNEDFLSMEEFESLVNSIKPDDVHKTARFMFSKPDIVEVMMSPKE
jgi:zinc protease